MKRKHLKAYQIEQYKVADKRIKKAANMALLYWMFPLHSDYIRLTGDFKRYHLI